MRFDPAGRQTEVVLYDEILRHLRPRWLWRPLERILTHQLHRRYPQRHEQVANSHKTSYTHGNRGTLKTEIHHPQELYRPAPQSGSRR